MGKFDDVKELGTSVKKFGEERENFVGQFCRASLVEKSVDIFLIYTSNEVCEFIASNMELLSIKQV